MLTDFRDTKAEFKRLGWLETLPCPYVDVREK